MGAIPSLTYGFGGYIKTVPTIAVLRSTPSKVARSKGDFIFVAGTLQAGDGAGGVYTWIPLSTADDDGQQTIRPIDITQDQPGRWNWSIKAESAVFEQIKSLQAEFDDPVNGVLALKALIEQETSVRFQQDQVIIDKIDTLEASVTGQFTDTDAKITDESTVRADADTALASRTTTLEAQVSGSGDSGLKSLIEQVDTAQTTTTTALAQRVTTLEAGGTDSGLEARVETLESAEANLNGRTAAYWQVNSVAGNNRAQLSVHADANGGAGVDIVGDVAINGNLVVSGTINTPQITPQAVNNILISVDGAHTFGASNGSFASNGVTITGTGGTIKIEYGVAYAKNSTNGNAYVQLQRDMDGSTITFGSSQYYAAPGGTAGAGQFYGATYDNIPAGHTARYYFYYNWTSPTNGGAWNYEQIAVTEIKR